MTQMLMDATDCRLVLAHEGGYSELHVPFCAHAVLKTMSGRTSTPQTHWPSASPVSSRHPNWTRSRSSGSTGLPPSFSDSESWLTR